MILAISTFMCISALSILPTTIADENEFDIIKTFQETIPEIQFGKGSIDIDTAMINAANYLVHAQADITEDNAGNGDPDVPDDPDDGGWDWSSTTFTHSTGASPVNIYGATAIGLYYAYLETNNASYKTALDDAAGYMSTNSNIRSASDLVFLMLYDDLPSVTGTTYQDAAKTKYDARIASYGNATAFAEFVRDYRGITNGYPNGIIAWDIGLFVKAAAMLHERYPSAGYDNDAADMAEVIWQDSFNDNPGYFDVIDNQGFDPTYANKSYYWYTLGITGLIDAFYSAQVHTSEISGLLTILLECQYPNGAFSYCYGANQYDEDWQSAAYAVNSLALADIDEYQTEINHACYWLYATQDQTSGGWVYSSGNHYPEIGGECTSALYFEEEILEVTQPVQITTNQSYERGQSITFDGTNYWMFYGRSEGCNESYGSGNPDVNDYVLYYEKAGSIEGLGQGSKGQVGIPVDDIYLGETGAAYLDGKVWVFAPVDVGTTCSLYGYYTDDSGETWYESGPYVSDMSDGQAHHDEIVFDDELWILEGSGDFHTMHSSTPTNEASFSTPLQVGALESLTGGLGHFFVDDTDLYLAVGSSGSYYIYWYNDTGTSWELVASKTISGYYDPFLFKVDDYYIFAAAPYTGGRQWIVGWTSTSIDSGFFDGRELSITEGRYGSNVWVDMWPIGYTDNDGDTFLFFTSERNPDDTDAEIDGNIWYLKYDWDPLNDHYTYIQEAIDAASGTIIKVAAGTYKEEVYIYKSLKLLGPNAGIHGTSTSRNPEAIIRLPDGLTGPGGYWGVPVYNEADDVIIDGFTISDEGYETSIGYDYFTGIASDKANNTVITNNIIKGFNYTSIILFHTYPAELPIDDIEISDNLIQENVGLYHAIYVQGAGGTVYGNTVDSCGGAIQIQPYAQPNGGVVTNNNLKGFVNGVYYNYASNGAGTWIIENNDISLADAPIGSKGDSLPKGNILSLSTFEMPHLKSGVNWSGLYLRTHGTSGTGTAPDVSFNNNIIDGFGATDPYWDEIRAVQIRNIHENSLGMFYGNNFTNADVGVFVYDDGNVDNIEFSENNFLGNIDGVENTNTYILDATCNWWGDISGPSGYGPGTGDSITENVDFIPWLDDTYPKGGCTLDCVETMYVDDDAMSSWYDYAHVDSIQTAIDRVCEGGTIYVLSGEYAESLDLSAKALTIDGDGMGNTIINASTFSGYAISNFGDDTTFKDVTLIGSAHYGFKISHVSNIILENIRVEKSGKTGVDINTVDLATLTNIEVVDTVSGFGIMILDSKNVTITDIMTDNNPWGGVSVHAVNSNAENIIFNGLFDAYEPAPLLLEQDPPYADFINVDVPDKFDYVVYGLRVGPNYKQWYYQENLTNAKTFANVLMSSGFTYSGMLIHDTPAKENYYVIPGMLIQDAIDDATGTTIHIDPGTYVEDVIIDKSLTINGSGEDLTFIKPTSNGPAITISANNIIIQDLEITQDTQLVEGIRIITGASEGLIIDHVDFTNLGNNPGPGNAYGIVIDNTFTDLFVNYCDFDATHIGEYSRVIGIYSGKNNGYVLTNINIENSTFTYHFVGIYISAETNGLYVKNNDFGPWELEDCTAAVAGLYMGDGKDNYDIENVVVTGNTFTTYGRGVYMWNYAPEQIYGKIDIYDNTFTDSIWSSAIRLIAGIGYDENVSYQGPITIADNTFIQTTDVGANVAMIDFRNYNTPKSCDITITDNDMTFSGGLYADAMYGIKFSAYEAPFNNTLIQNNIIDGGGTSGAGTIPASAIVIDHYSEDYWPTDTLEIEVIHNDITGFDQGMSIYDQINSNYGGLPTGSLVNVNYNNIQGNSLYGIRNNNSESVNAECNWWGHISGPSGVASGSGDAVTANVDFLPWLDDAYPDGNCVGGTCADPVWVDDDAASSWYDWDHVASIQTAVDRVCNGGTVHVIDGGYSGAIINKSVTILGSTTGISIISSGVPYKSGSGLESAFRLDSGADGTEIRNLTINCNATTNFYFAVFSRSVDNVVIDSFEINDAVQGISNYDGNNWKITNNILTDTIASGGGGIGIMFGVRPPQDQCSGNLVKNNIIYADGTEAGYTAPGICLALDTRYGAYDYLTGSEEITNNEISNNLILGTGNTNEVGIEVGVIGVSGNSSKVAFTMGMIHDNLIKNNTVDGSDYGIYAYVVENLAIEENEVKNCNSYGISLWDDFTGNINHNNIFGNGDYGLWNNLTSQVEATCNWWGSTTGPNHASNSGGTGDNVSDNVAFMPWLDDAYPYGDCSGGAIVHNLNSDEWFITIQEAIDDTDTVNGDTLEIIATTHSEGPQIVINKDVTIMGQGCSSTIITPTGNTGSGGDARGWWLVNDGIELHLSDLTLDGTGNDIYQGIRHKGSGTIDQVCFHEIKYPGYGGVAVAAFGGGPVDITNCEFTEIGRVGVLYWVTGSLFEGNTYVGKGDGDWLDYCLDIGGGGGVSVIDNTISDCTGVASSDGSESAGVLVTTHFAPGTSATIEENDISDCTMAIAVGYDSSDTSSVTANYNNFFNCEWGITSTAPLVDGTCNWWDDILGPYHSDDNPMGLGCNVSDNVTFIPWLDDAYPYGDCNGYPGLLTADFDYNPLNPSAYDTVTFTDQSTVTGATIVNWTWTFGDGDSSYLQNPTHQYTTDGKYPVTLTVTDDLGHTDTMSKLVPVGPIQLATLMGNYWNIISMPFNETVNKNDVLIKYDNAFYSWSQAVSQGLIINFIYGWDESIQSYQFVTTLEPGQGYWVFAYVDCELWVDEVTTPEDFLIADVGTYWNLFGLPFDQTVDKVDVVVRYDNVDHTWNEAVTDGIVVNFVYGWNAAIQSYQFANTFNPGYGYWLFAYQPCRLKQTI